MSSPILVSSLPRNNAVHAPQRTMIRDRHGNKVALSFDQITERNASLAAGLSRVNLTLVTERVISDRSDDMTTADLDMLSIHACEDLDIREDSQYRELASAIAWSNLVKTAPATFKESTEIARANGLLNEAYATFTLAHIDELTKMMRDEMEREMQPTYLRDLYSYLAYNMLTGTYLFKVVASSPNTMKELADGTQREAKKEFRVIERPSYALMRVAIQQHMPDLDEIRRSVECYYGRGICPATPLWQYSGAKRSCVASCNLYSIHDSMAGIQKSWIQQSTISSRGGGLGGTWSHLRTKNSVIRSTGGLTKSAVSWCQAAQTISDLVNQGGKRDGSNAVYFDIAHGDVQDLINLKNPNAGKDDIRCPNLHTAIWCCDLFFARLEYQVQHDNETLYWPMFNPADVPEVMTTWGVEKTTLIERLEREGRYVERVPISKIWNQYLTAVADKGEPYLMHGCTANLKSSHNNIGTIDSSNLCTEILMHHSPDLVGVCILSSICLPKCLTISNPTDPNKTTYGFSFAELERNVRQAVRNLTAICMFGEQALPECKAHVDLLRSIAIGVQGLADVFANCHLPFGSPHAAQLNQLIMEHLYYYALAESNALVEKYGVYPGWNKIGPNGEIPPLKRGLFHWQIENVQPTPMKSSVDSCANINGGNPLLTPLTLKPGLAIVYRPDPVSERGRRSVLVNYAALDWDGLRQKIVKHGVANSLLIGLMPTMSTSKIMGWTDSFEPSENLCVFKNNASSSSMQVFKPLYEDLHRLGVYSSHVLEHLQTHSGSIQELELPADIQWMKRVYLTVYEVDPLVRLNLAITSQPFVDQSMSQNVYFDIATKSLLTTWHIKAWRGGLKTGSYYTRSKPAVLGAKVSSTVSTTLLKKAVAVKQAPPSKAIAVARVPAQAKRVKELDRTDKTDRTEKVDKVAENQDECSIDCLTCTG